MIPKRDLVAGMLVRLERGQLKIAEGLKGGEEFAREIAGGHVDLVVAVVTSDIEPLGIPATDERG